MPENHDSLNHEFQRQLQIAKILMSKMKKHEDRSIIAQYIKQCLALNEDDIYIKKNRNEFFRYFLQMLHTASQIQPKDDPLPATSPEDWSNKKNEPNEKTSSYWSKDRRTYTASKVIPGFGILIYMAVANDPELGWTQFKKEISQ